MSLVEKVRAAGVVGAGGGGFPAHVKLAAKADTVIANGAECEPLLHKDSAVLEQRAAEVVRGMELAVDAVGAKEGVIGIKAKNRHAVEAAEAACKGTRVRVHLLGDYYPAGDEYDLVHSITGRLIPPAGLPIHVGAVVQNVETLANIAAAAEGRPVTRKYVTIAGAVKRPCTLIVPIGTSFREAIEAAGGLATDDAVLCVGGLMMGTTTDDLDTPITKTSTGAVVLPRSHPVIQRKLRPPESQARIGKSACDQCRYCTEFCPRFLLGYAVEPHQVMRGLGFTQTGAKVWNQWASLCCSCGLCTLYSCPEMLYPKEACDDAKVALRVENVKWTGPMTPRAHPMHADRRVPIRALARKLHVLDYDVPTPSEARELMTKRVVLPLKQHAGAPAAPVVKVGDRVKEGQLVAAIPKDALAANLHAPFEARAESVTDKAITLVKD